jgi:Myosin N-terminal SH3-like domain
MADSFNNPFGDDPDFQYLALDRKKMLEEAPQYDAKTSCWIVDHKEGYAKANIKSTKGDDVTVLVEQSMEVIIVFVVTFVEK